MIKKFFGLALILFLAAILGGCIGPFKKLEATFTVKQLSVNTLAPGETTSILGSGFGDIPGIVFLDKKQKAEIVSWKDKVIRIRIPTVPEATYQVDIAPPKTKRKFAGQIAVRASVDEGIYTWVDGGPEAVKGASMEPLVLVFKPVGPKDSGLFDTSSPIPKARNDMLDEIEWAYIMGVQVVQLQFPAVTPTGANEFFDTSMDNIRDVINDISRRCPGMIIDVDYAGMPDGNREIARRMTKPSVESVLNIGSFEPPDGSKLNAPSLPDAGKINTALSNSFAHSKQPIPVVMTTWQASDLAGFIQGGAALPQPGTYFLRMALDKRAVDNRETYDNLKTFLPPGARIIATTTLEHVNEIMGYAITQGDHLAFGYNYSLYWPGNSKYYIPNNLFLVEKAIQVAEKIRRPLARPEMARKILGLKNRPAFGKTSIKVKNITAGNTGTVTVKNPGGRGRRTLLGGLPSNTITALCSSYDLSELWLLTDSGIYVSDDNGGTYQRIRYDYGRTGMPSAIAATSDGAVWIATPGSGIMKTVDRGNSAAKYSVETKSLLGNYVTCLHSYGGEIYACTNGAEEGNPGKGITYSTDGGANWYVWTAKFGLPYDDVRAIYVEDEYVYAGFGPYSSESDAAGMAVSSDFGESWQVVKGIDKPVLAINAWQDNTIIVGTKGGGAFITKYNGSQARKITGVPETATVSDIIVDGRGWLWLVTDSGIMVSDNPGKSFKTFTTSAGVGSLGVTGGAFIVSGDMMFSTKPEGDSPGGLTRISVAP